MSNHEIFAKLNIIMDDLSPSKNWDKNEKALNEIIVSLLFLQ